MLPLAFLRFWAYKTFHMGPEGTSMQIVTQRVCGVCAGKLGRRVTGVCAKCRRKLLMLNNEQGLGVGPNDARWHQRGDSSVDT